MDLLVEDPLAGRSDDGHAGSVADGQGRHVGGRHDGGGGGGAIGLVVGHKHGLLHAGDQVVGRGEGPFEDHCRQGVTQGLGIGWRSRRCKGLNMIFLRGLMVKQQLAYCLY